MAQLELPQISWQRYLDLIRRRRWQLVPFAILGLVVGGVVAALIPRYYEATTQMRFHHTVLEGREALPAGEDPFLRELESAGHMVRQPHFVARAIEELGWPDYFPVGGRGGRYNPRVVEAAKRVRYVDLNPGRRASAQVQISYRDRDARRAAGLANKIRDLYLDSEWERVRERALDELDRLRTDLQAAKEEEQQRRTDLVQAESTYDLAPVPQGPLLRDPMDWRRERLARAVGERDELEARLRELLTTTAALRASVDAGTIPRTVRRTPEIVDPVLRMQYEHVGSRIVAIENSLANWTEANPQYAYYSRRLDELQRQRRRILELAGVGEEEQVPNPRYLDAVERLREREAELAGLEARLEATRDLEESLRKELAGLPRRMADRESRREAHERARANVKALHQELDQKLWHYSAVAHHMRSVAEVQYHAYPPEDPTYPNIWIVAAIGCLIGLLVAVGLVLLLDFLRSSFKTVEEVGRSLGLTVLGVQSHLETAEEKAAATRRRLRVALTCAAALLLVGAVVGLYFADRLRLPAFVVSVLDAVLGAG